MSDRELNIRLTMDKSAATQQSKAFHDAERQRIRETTDAAKAAEKERTAAQKEALAEAKRASRETEAALRERIQAEKSLKVVLTEQQTAERARSELTQQLNRKRIDSAKEAMIAERRQFQSLKESTDGVSSATEGLVGRYATLGAAAGMVRTVGAAWQDVIAKQRQAIAEFNQITANSRVGAGVAGQTPEQYAAGSLRLSVSSGLAVADADVLKRQFEGSLPIGLEKGNITRGVADELLQGGAAMGARLGGDQGTRGEMLGLLAQFGKVGSAKEGLAQMEAVRQGLTAGRGDDSPLSKALLNVAGGLVREGGMVGSIAENAALVGITSLAGGPGMADTRALQLTRAVRGTTTKQAQALEKQFGIKVGSTEGLESRLGKMIPKLREIQAGGTDVSAYLRDTLDLPEENAQALLEMMPNFEAFQQRAKLARETAAGGGDSVVAANEKFARSATGRTMRADAKGAAGRFLQGERVKQFGAMTAEEQARLDSQDPSVMLGVQSRVMGAASYVIPGVGTQAENYANADLERQLGAAGVSNPYGGILGGARALFTPPAARGSAMIGALEGAGITPQSGIGGGAAEKIVAGLTKLIEKTEEGNRDRRQASQPPLNVGPPQDPAARPR